MNIDDRFIRDNQLISNNFKWISEPVSELIFNIDFTNYDIEKDLNAKVSEL